MIPLIQKEVVNNNKWIDDKEFMDMLAIAQSVPGPIAVNTAVFVGYKLKSITGAIVASVAVVLPAFMVMMAIVLFFTKIKDNEIVIKVFKGIRPVVVAMIAASVYTLAKKNELKKINIIISCVTAALVAFGSISPVYIILVLIVYGLCRKKHENNNETSKVDKSE